MQLIMNGNVISSPSLFCKHFSPTDILIRKEETARFLVNIMGPCSSENYFNAVVFLINVYETDETALTPDNYKNFSDGLSALKKRQDNGFEEKKREIEKNKASNPFYPLELKLKKLEENRKQSLNNENHYLEKWFKNQRTQNILQDIYGLVLSTSLADIKEKNQLFALLASAYLIADKTLAELPLSPEAAQSAFKKIKPARITITDECKEQPSEEKLIEADDAAANEIEEKTTDIIVEDSDFTVFSEKENPVRGRDVAYKLKLRSSYTINSGEIIEPRKIIACPSAFGTPIPVKLHIYDSNGVKMVDEIEIPSGDYIFANYVGQELVCIHPVSAETDRCRVERKGKQIILTDKNSKKEYTAACNDQVVAVVPEQHNCGYIGINTYGAFFDGYSIVNSLDDVSDISKDIVQVICAEHNIYMLHNSGLVFKDMKLDLCRTLYSDLRKYLEERQ